MTRRRIGIRGVVNVALVVVLMALGAWRLLPRERTFTAELANASGLATGDPVRVAGIDVGKVKSIRLDHGVVRTRFTVRRDVPVSRRARAEVKLATILGQHYLAVVPGPGSRPGDRLGDGGTIPLRQTRSAYTIDKFQVDAKDTVTNLDAQALADAVDALTQGIDGDPDANRRALSGITAVSRTIASRQDELGRLIHSTRVVSDVVHDQQGSLLRLLGDADAVAEMIQQRRQTIQLLLRSTRSMVHQVTLLVRANQKKLEPALRELRTLMGTLADNRRALDQTLRAVTAQSRYFANATGNGPWIEVFAPDFLVTDNILCAVTSPTRCR